MRERPPTEPRSSRRTYLLAIGTSLTAALAGCPGNTADNGDGNLPETTDSSTSDSDGQAPTTATSEGTTPPPASSATPTQTPAVQSSPTPSTDGATATAAKSLVREFYAAADSGNFEKANNFVHPESPEGTIGENQQAFFEQQEVEIQRIETVTASEARVTVQATLVLSRQERERTTTTNIELRKHNEEWYLYAAG